MTRTTRSITSIVIAIIMVMTTLCTICSPAYAYDNTVDIYVNGTKVDGVQAYMDGNGVVWVSDSLKATRKLFPKETADLYFPDVVEERELQDMANAFGYTLKLDGRTAYLTNGNGSSGNNSGSNNNSNNNGNNNSNGNSNNSGGNNSGTTGKPNDSTGGNNNNTKENQVTIYVNGKKVSVDAYTIQGDDTVWLRYGFTALLKLFPTEAAEEHFTGKDVEMRLKPYAVKYGYMYEVNGSKVYLDKEEEPEERQELTIYVDGDKVSRVTAWLEEDVVWLENGYSAIRRIFPVETANQSFPSQTIDQKLKPYAVEFGYKMELKGSKVYLTKQNNGNNNGSNNNSNNNGGNNNSTTSIPVIITNGIKITGSNAYMDADGTVWLKEGYKDLKKLLPEESIIENQGVPIAEFELKTWAEKYGYTFQQRGNTVTLTKQITVQNTVVKVYLNGMRVVNSEFEMGKNQEILFNYNDIYKIFPEATQWKTNLNSLTGARKPSNSLKRWAEFYKYSYIQNGPRVYINNNGQKPLEIHVNGKIVDFPDQQPFVNTGRTMVPIRSVAEMLGCNVEWVNGTVRISSGNKTFILYVGTKTYTVNGVEYSMDVAPYVQNNRTLVPIRFIAEAFDFTVKWNGGKTIDVVTLTK